MYISELEKSYFSLNNMSDFLFDEFEEDMFFLNDEFEV